MVSQGGSERREFARISVALSIRFRRLKDFGNFIHANATDLSQGGVFIKTDTPKRIGTSVQMQIPLPDGKIISLQGTVRHILYDTTSPDNLPLGMGIQFENLDDDSREFISKVLQIDKD